MTLWILIELCQPICLDWCMCLVMQTTSSGILSKGQNTFEAFEAQAYNLPKALHIWTIGNDSTFWELAKSYPKKAQLFEEFKFRDFFCNWPDSFPNHLISNPNTLIWPASPFIIWFLSISSDLSHVTPPIWIVIHPIYFSFIFLYFQHLPNSGTILHIVPAPWSILFLLHMMRNIFALEFIIIIKFPLELYLFCPLFGG